MQELQQAWTIGWHECLDRELGPEVGVNPEKRLSDPGADFRMHFETWQLSEQGLRDCFGLLPGGDVLIERVLDPHAWAVNQVISEDRSREMLAKAIADLSQYADLGVDLDTPVRVVRGTPSERDALNAEPAYEDWIPSEQVWEAEATSLSGEMAKVYYFLSETLYQRTSYYYGNYFVMWPFIDATSGVDPFGNLLQTARSEITWLKDSNGLIIFYNDDQTINDSYPVTLEFDGAGVQDVTKQIEAGLAAVVQHHRVRGFPERRFDSFTIGLNGPAAKHTKPRRISAPHEPVDNPGWLPVEQGRLALGPGNGLLLDADALGEVEPALYVMVHMRAQGK